MFLKIKNIQMLILTLLITTLFANKSTQDLFYNYYILNGSPNSIEFNYLLENNYESDLIHKLETNGIASEASENYEKFLRTYYHQYQKENIRFINAIVEPDIFYISASLGTTNIIMGNNNYSFGKTMGFHIDSPYAFKLLNKTIVLGLKSSFISLPPSNSLNWDNFRSINMSSTYSIKFGKHIFALSGLGITLNSNNNGSTILPLMSFNLAYELPWKPLNIPFDITFCSSTSWDLKNVTFGFSILLCKPYKIQLEI